MSQTLPEIDVMFVAGFGPISRDTASSTAFYIQTLGLPLKPMEGNAEYLEGRLQERYGWNRERAHDEVKAFERSLRSDMKH